MLCLYAFSSLSLSLSLSLPLPPSHLQGEYIHRPLELVRVVQMCLITEAELVHKQEELQASTVSLLDNNCPYLLYPQFSLLHK